MDTIKSKPLSNSDISGAEFVKEMLKGDPTCAINFDRIQWDKKENRYVIVEFLLCEESQKVNPWSSHPNNYFNKNKQKFISLWQISKTLNARLYLVNYAKKDSTHADKVLLMEVINIDPRNKVCPVETKNIVLNREEFSKWFRQLNMRGCIKK